MLVCYSHLSFITNLLSSIYPDHDLKWETASSSDSDVYDPSQINTKDGSLSVRLDNLQGQVEDRHQGQCTGDEGRGSLWGWGWGWGGWKGGDEAKQGNADRSLSGILKLKVPLCLSRGGLVEVGLGKKDFGSDPWSGLGLKREGAGKGGKPEDEGTLRRLIYVRLLSFAFTFADLFCKFIVARQLRFMVFIQPKRKPEYTS